MGHVINIKLHSPFDRPPSPLISSSRSENKSYSKRVRGETYGGEISASDTVSQWWGLQGSYSLFRGQWGAGPGDRNALSSFVPGQTPRHQFQIRSSFSPLSSLALDRNLFYASGWTAYPIPSLTRLDTRVG